MTMERPDILEAVPYPGHQRTAIVLRGDLLRRPGSRTKRSDSPLLPQFVKEPIAVPEDLAGLYSSRERAMRAIDEWLAH